MSVSRNIAACLVANFGFREELTGSLIGFGTASLDVKARQDVAELEYAEDRNSARSIVRSDTVRLINGVTQCSGMRPKLRVQLWRWQAEKANGREPHYIITWLSKIA